jgi:hypothetical protein
MVAFAYDSTAAVRTLRLTRGRPFRCAFSTTLKPANEPLPLDGYAITAVATLFDMPDLVAEFAVSIDAADRGLFSIYLDDEQTAELDAGSYWWELRWERPDGYTQTIVEGTLEVVNRGCHP